MLLVYDVDGPARSSTPLAGVFFYLWHESSPNPDRKLCAQVDSLANKSVCSDACNDSPQSNGTIYFDALETISLSHSCSIMDDDTEVNCAYPGRSCLVPSYCSHCQQVAGNGPSECMSISFFVAIHSFW